MTATWAQARPATTSAGRLIQQHRERLHLSQGDVARLAGLERTMISRLESGSRCCSVETIGAIADGLGLGEIDRAVLLSHCGFVERPFDELRAHLLCDYWLRGNE